MENNEQNNKINVDDMLDQQSKQIRESVSSSKKKSIFDIDLSWVAIIVLGLAIFGIAYAFQQTKAGLGAGYVVLFVLVSLILGIFVYTLGKVIFGLISGYKVKYMEALGICIYLTSKGSKVTFEFGKVLEMHILFAPKDPTLDKKPTLLSLGGTITFVVVGGILLGLTFTDIFPSSAKLITQYGLAIASSVVIYELLPIGYANNNDMFNLIKTSSKDNCLAFNNYLYNKACDTNHEELVPVEFEEYDHSKFKPWTLIYLADNLIYENKINEAEKVLNKLDEYEIVTNSYVKCEAGYQKIFIYLTSGRSKQANDLITKLEKQVKNAEDYHMTISSLRSDILVSAFIENSLESTQESIKTFIKTAKSLPITPRVEKELNIVNNLIPRINQAHPDWKLDVLSLQEAKKEKVSNNVNNEDEDDED